MYAALLDRISLAELAELTDYQIQQLYCHPRDEHGRVAPQRERKAMTPEEEDEQLRAFAARFGGSHQVEELIRKKRGQDGGATPGNDTPEAPEGQ